MPATGIYRTTDMATVATAGPFDTDVSPPREVRSTDVSRLRAQAGAIVTIVVFSIGIVLYIERGNEKLRADNADVKAEIRLILNRLDSQRENLDLKLQNMKLEFEKGELRKALLAELKDNP